MEKILSFFEKHKNTINRVSPWFLMAYYCFVCFPYVFARVYVLNNLFTNSTVAFLLRFGFLLLYFLFGTVVMIANKLRVNYLVLFGSILLFLMFIVSTFASPDTIVYYSFYFTGKISISETTLGVYIKLVHIARFGGDLVFFFFLLCSYPYSFTNKNSITLIVLPAVVIATIAVFYTLLVENDSISIVLNGGNPEILKSIFHSKNAYGIFLFNGTAATTFIFFNDNRKYTKLTALLLPVFLSISILINCKLAAVCISILLALSYVYCIFKYIKAKTYISIILLVIAFIASLMIILVFTVPYLRQADLFYKVYSIIIDSFNNMDIGSFIGRTEEWSMVPRMTYGIYRWIGFSTPVGYELVTSYTSINGATSRGVYDLHNAYVDFYAYHGIIGCALLGLFYSYIIYLLYKLFRNDKSMTLFISIVFFVSILFGMAETYRLFLSMSANTFALNFIILGVLLFELKDDKTVIRPNISFSKIFKNSKEAANNA